MALLVFLCSPRYCVDISYKSLSVGEAAPTMQQPGQLDEAAMTTGFRSNLSPTELTSGEKGHTPVFVDTESRVKRGESKGQWQLAPAG